MIRMIMITPLVVAHFFATPSYASQSEQNEEQPRSSLTVTDMIFEDNYAEEDDSEEYAEEEGSSNQSQLINQNNPQEKKQTKSSMHDIPEESEEGEDDDDRTDTTYEEIDLDYYPNPLSDQNYQENNLPQINNDINPAQITHGLPPLVMSIHVNGHKINLRDMQP